MMTFLVNFFCQFHDNRLKWEMKYRISIWLFFFFIIAVTIYRIIVMKFWLWGVELQKIKLFSIDNLIYQNSVFYLFIYFLYIWKVYDTIKIGFAVIKYKKKMQLNILNLIKISMFNNSQLKMDLVFCFFFYFFGQFFEIT